MMLQPWLATFLAFIAFHWVSERVEERLVFANTLVQAVHSHAVFTLPFALWNMKRTNEDGGTYSLSSKHIIKLLNQYRFRTLPLAAATHIRPDESRPVDCAQIKMCDENKVVRAAICAGEHDRIRWPVVFRIKHTQRNTIGSNFKICQYLILFFFCFFSSTDLTSIYFVAFFHALFLPTFCFHFWPAASVFCIISVFCLRHTKDQSWMSF